MGLHDRLSGRATAPPRSRSSRAAATGRASTPDSAADPYGDLKARIHHQCIAKLGPELFKQDGDDLVDRGLPRRHRGARARPHAADARRAHARSSAS